MHKNLIVKTFKQHGFPLTAHQTAQFELYRDELLRWNERINLTAITDKVEITHKHFLDSLGVLEHIALESGDTVIDIGTGAGFPGLVLKIYVPDIRLTLVEASKKKGSFLRFLIAKLNLHQKVDVEVLTERAEVCAQVPKHTGAYDWAFTRYVATLRDSAAYCIPFLKPTGKWVAYKSRKEIIDTEISESAMSLNALGGDVETVFTTRILNRSYVVIRRGRT